MRYRWGCRNLKNLLHHEGSKSFSEYFTNILFGLLYWSDSRLNPNRIKHLVQPFHIFLFLFASSYFAPSYLSFLHYLLFPLSSISILLLLLLLIPFTSFCLSFFDWHTLKIHTYLTPARCFCGPCADPHLKITKLPI